MSDIKQRFFQDDYLEQMPRKEQDRLQVFDVMIQYFKFDRTYTEQEVNKVLRDVCGDFALMRRYLVTYGYLARNDNGSAYIRVAEKSDT